MELTDIATDKHKQSHTVGYDIPVPHGAQPAAPMPQAMPPMPQHAPVPQMHPQGRVDMGYYHNPYQQYPDNVFHPSMPYPAYPPTVVTTHTETVGRTVGEVLDDIERIRREADALTAALSDMNATDYEAYQTVEQIRDGKNREADELLDRLRVAVVKL